MQPEAASAHAAAETQSLASTSAGSSPELAPPRKLPVSATSLFAAIDLDQDGTVDLQELRRALALGIIRTKQPPTDQPGDQVAEASSRPSEATSLEAALPPSEDAAAEKATPPEAAATATQGAAAKPEEPEAHSEEREISSAALGQKAAMATAAEAAEAARCMQLSQVVVQNLLRAAVARQEAAEQTTAAAEAALEQTFPAPLVQGEVAGAASLALEHSSDAAREIAEAFTSVSLSDELAAALREEEVATQPTEDVVFVPSDTEALREVAEAVTASDATPGMAAAAKPDDSSLVVQPADVPAMALESSKDEVVRKVSIATKLSEAAGEAAKVEKGDTASLHLETAMSTAAAMSAETLKNVAEAASEMEVASREVTMSAGSATSGSDGVAMRQLTRAATQLEEMLQPDRASSRRSLVRKASAKDLSLECGEGEGLANQVQVVAQAFESLAKAAAQEESQLEVAPAARPALSRAVSRSSTTSLSKTRKKCRSCYSGFGDTCSGCRKFGRAGSTLQCGRCQNYFAGFGGVCNDCAVPDDRAAALADAAEKLAAAAVAVAAVSQLFAPPRAIRSRA